VLFRRFLRFLSLPQLRIPVELRVKRCETMESLMKSSLSLVFALFAGCAAGAAALGAAHAQARPPAYSIAELIELHDPAAMREFVKRNAAGIKAAGGHLLAQRGRIVAGNGSPPKAAGMAVGANLDQAVGYFNSAYFKDLIPLRDKAAKQRLFIVEGLAK
jgi:uncharacterized protein (DUF1330 family)